MSSACIQNADIRKDEWFRIARDLLRQANIEINGPAQSDI